MDWGMDEACWLSHLWNSRFGERGRIVEERDGTSCSFRMKWRSKWQGSRSGSMGCWRPRWICEGGFYTCFQNEKICTRYTLVSQEGESRFIWPLMIAHDVSYSVIYSREQPFWKVGGQDLVPKKKSKVYRSHLLPQTLKPVSGFNRKCKGSFLLSILTVLTPILLSTFMSINTDKTCKAS